MVFAEKLQAQPSIGDALIRGLDFVNDATLNGRSLRLRGFEVVFSQSDAEAPFACGLECLRVDCEPIYAAPETETFWRGPSGKFSPLTVRLGFGLKPDSNLSASAIATRCLAAMING